MDKAEPPNLNHGQLNYPLPVGNQMSSVTMASSSGPGLWTGIPSEDDQRLREVGMAALAALAQNPPLYEENEHGVVDQVVAAVTGINQPMFRSSIMDMETSDKNSESDVDGLSCPGSLETEDQAHASTPSDQDISGVRRVNNTSEYNIASDAEMDHLGQRIESELNTMMDYDSPRETSASSPASDLEENIEEMLRFYPGEEEFFRRRNPSLSGSQSTHPPRANLDLRDFYIRVHYDNIDPSHPSHFEDPQAMAEPMNELDLIEAVPFLHTNIFENNQTVDEFVEAWIPVLEGRNISPARQQQLQRNIDRMIAWRVEPRTERPDRSQLHNEEFFDLQQIPWDSVMGASRAEARIVRDQWYTSYHNIRNPVPRNQQNILPETELQFREQAMYTEHTALIEHFQLRNLMSVPSHDTVHFAADSVVSTWTPSTNSYHTLIDLSEPDIEAGFQSPVKIASMKTQHGIVVAGGFCGEYAFKSTDAEGDGTKGLATPDFNDGITNHVDIVPSRTGPSPTIVFSSNDRHLRTLDTETDIFTSDQEMATPINCSATSPDSRLRVVIGDSPTAWIIEADTGRPVAPLRGHRDFGFACAWSPDMLHIATSNQDKTLKIWDARTWRVLETIDSDVAGYRSLRYSPVGGGPRSLLCNEPADRISIINAQMYQTRQVHEFFGEIGGADFSPDGGHIWVANTDPHFGGFMHYQRYQWGARYGLTDLPNEWLHEDELDHDGRSVYSARERSLRFLHALDDPEYDEYML